MLTYFFQILSIESLFFHFIPLISMLDFICFEVFFFCFVFVCFFFHCLITFLLLWYLDLGDIQVTNRCSTDFGFVLRAKTSYEWAPDTPPLAAANATSNSLTSHNLIHEQIDLRTQTQSKFNSLNQGTREVFKVQLHLTYRTNCSCHLTTNKNTTNTPHPGHFFMHVYFFVFLQK